MKPHFAPIGDAQPHSLYAKTPEGFYLDLTSEVAAKYLVYHGNSDGPMAIRLDVPEPVAMFLPKQPERFQVGLWIGPVEVEVDFSEAISSNCFWSVPGDLFQAGEEGLWLKGRMAGEEHEQAILRISPARRWDSLGNMVIYPAWRLVRRNSDGTAVELFVREASAAVARPRVPSR